MSSSQQNQTMCSSVSIFHGVSLDFLVWVVVDWCFEERFVMGNDIICLIFCICASIHRICGSIDGIHGVSFY
jgi:hypothetical protein